MGGSPPMEETVEGAGSRLKGFVEGGRGGKAGLFSGGVLAVIGGGKGRLGGLSAGGGAKSVIGFIEVGTVVVVSVEKKRSSREGCGF